MLPPGSPEFSGLFDAFQHTAYRLEALQEYREPTEAEALEAFTCGRVPTIYPGKAAWVSFVSAASAAGKIMQRIHAVSEPLSGYLQYEIGWSYGHNVTAGEDVRILCTPWPTGLPESDYWLFDSSVLARMHYAGDGQMTGVQLIEDPHDIVSACYWRDAALHAAVPYCEYLGTVHSAPCKTS
jgi:hypothetical protein